MKIRFAAFVMTYKRSGILSNTISNLFQQTYPPEKVLIIDNDPEQSAHSVFQQLTHLSVGYHAVGYNSGPAGAAKIGLEILSNEGYDWIAWIDDDDPPIFPDVCEILLQTATTQKKCGSVGVVGHHFNYRTGFFNRISDEEVKKIGVMEVDFIAGNMIKIINAAMIRKHDVFPNSDLFFGFEDLDMDLKTKKAGYHLYVDKGLFLRYRIAYNGINKKQIKGARKNENSLWRDYYSTRSMLIILKEQHQHLALFVTIVRVFYKSISNYKYGIKYGWKNMKLNLLGLIDFCLRKKGQTIFKI